MANNAPKTVYAKDYKRPDYQIDHVDMTFELDSEATKATAKMNVRRENGVADGTPMWLDGEELTLAGLEINGKPLEEKDYVLSEEGLMLLNPPKDFTLTVRTDLNPKANTKLQGLYESDGILCTKCETHGFRRITFFPDRPDVMPTWRTTLIADKEKQPVLVSNGNKESVEELEDGRQKQVFFDPVPKACYLYAVVAGKLDQRQDHFVTRSGRDVELNVFVETGKGDMSSYAIESLKKAMKWDEDTFGREYDHDVFNIVAVSNFNSGACENTSLNIFNDKYVLVDDKRATDADYASVESVVGHEYFHNWSGNRVTLRDWFDLTLKEGLTVYRDQEFSSDMRSRAVKRIEDAASLRAGQFTQDAGPLAHPIRPDSYISVRSLYTGTVYNKGAEVIRMMERMVGKEAFRKGMDLYFERNDGKAVTCHDFVQAISDGAGVDLRQFENAWYHQAGTPEVTAKGVYDPLKKTYALTLSQRTPATPGQPIKKPFVIPLETGLLDKNGNDMPLHLQGGKESGNLSEVLVLNKPEQTFVFENVPEEPVLSANRGFTAPIHFKTEYTPEQRALLMAKDSDLFNRWDAGQQFATDIMLDMVKDIQAGKTPVVPAPFTEALRGYLNDDALDKAFIAKAFALPTERAVAERMDVVDVDAIHQARSLLRREIATQLKPELLKAYESNEVKGEYVPNAEDSGKRAVRNMALGYLSIEDDTLALKQYYGATQMTDKDAAVRCFAGKNTPEAKAVMNDFYETYKKDSLVVDKWLTMQASAASEQTLDTVKALMNHESFVITNPNKVRALIGAFASNPTVFHAKDGSGYDFIAEQTIAVDKINPQVAANLPVALGAWKKYDPERQEKMKAALEKIINTPNLSPNTYEIVSKSLGIEKKPEPVKARAFREAEGTKTFKSGAHAGNVEPNVLMQQALKAKGR